MQDTTGRFEVIRKQRGLPVAWLPFLIGTGCRERRSQVHDGDRVKRRKTDPREAFAINKWIDDEAKNAAELPPVLSENRDQIRVIQEELHEFAMKLLESIAIAIGVGN
jgi:hypothetical protein